MEGNYDGALRRALVGVALTAALLGPGLSARAQGLEEPFREPYLKALQGKVVAYLPVGTHPDALALLVVGNKDEIKPPLDALNMGSVTPIDITIPMPKRPQGGAPEKEQ